MTIDYSRVPTPPSSDIRPPQLDPKGDGIARDASGVPVGTEIPPTNPAPAIATPTIAAPAPDVDGMIVCFRGEPVGRIVDGAVDIPGHLSTAPAIDARVLIRAGLLTSVTLEGNLT